MSEHESEIVILHGGLRHLTEVCCQHGAESVTIPPTMGGDNKPGVDHSIKYIRTVDTDEAGRIIYRPEPSGS